MMDGQGQQSPGITPTIPQATYHVVLGSPEEPDQLTPPGCVANAQEVQMPDLCLPIGMQNQEDGNRVLMKDISSMEIQDSIFNAMFNDLTRQHLMGQSMTGIMSGDITDTSLTLPGSYTNMSQAAMLHADMPCLGLSDTLGQTNAWQTKMNPHLPDLKEPCGPKENAAVFVSHCGEGYPTQVDPADQLPTMEKVSIDFPTGSHFTTNLSCTSPAIINDSTLQVPEININDVSQDFGKFVVQFYNPIKPDHLSVPSLVDTDIESASSGYNPTDASRGLENLCNPETGYPTKSKQFPETSSPESKNGDLSKYLPVSTGTQARKGHTETVTAADMNLTKCIANAKSTVTLDEARHGLKNAIAYFKAQPDMDKGHIQTLKKILEHLDKGRLKKKKVPTATLR